MSNKHRYIQEIKHIVWERHISAQDVLWELKKTYPLVGQATVYRNLQELVDDKVLMKTKGLWSMVLYETYKPPHGHIVCKGGDVIHDIDLPLELTDMKFPEGFTPENISILVEGTFEDSTCRGKREKSS